MPSPIKMLPLLTLTWYWDLSGLSVNRLNAIKQQKQAEGRKISNFLAH